MPYLSMLSERLIDHFQSPRNVGELPAPAVTVEVENPACGDVLRLSVTLEAGRVVAARYRVRGCTASIAAGSALTELLLERGPEGVTAEDLEDAVGGLPIESKHAAALCLDALRRLNSVLTTARSE
ncbi:MAG: iron-sulfur cluster assembly scaffold protein [Acidobacteriota bacterium]|nr:iron-sulfur cluster assembly scaffold protein [Acidobacteriota bacterium]